MNECISFVLLYFHCISFSLTFTCSKSVLVAMQRLLNARELQDILTAILRSDSNGDFTLGGQELEVLLVRLTSFSAADETKLRTVLQSHKNESVSSTTLYHDLVVSGSFANGEEPDEVDYTFGYRQWLFDEDA